MGRRDPYLKAASLVLRHLARTGRPTDIVDQAAHDLVRRQSCLDRTYRQQQKAARHGWHAAAALTRCQLLAEVYDVQRQAAHLIQLSSNQAEPQPQFPQSLSAIHADLLQLQREFAAVELRLKEKVIAVQTDPITLQDVDLGPFSIELHLGRLRRLNCSCFDCVALEPNPAQDNPSVTHPHVRNQDLCPGDATVPVSNALKEGRIADAFCLVNAVLQEYNPGSPHVSLDNWSGDGEHCNDCDRMLNLADVYYCDGCERCCCDNCTRCCAGCEQIFCANCLEEDREVEESFCRTCRRRCAKCNRVVGLRHCDQGTGQCRDCLDGRSDDPTPNNLAKELHEPNEPSPIPVLAPVAAAG
jgi:hypothetical protein